VRDDVVAVRAASADWPMYPEEHGADLALLWLTAFSDGTAFKAIDYIDQCHLFVADIKGSNPSKPFSEKNFHVAVWDEDLRELNGRGLIEGVLGEREWTKSWQSNLPAGRYYIQLPDGASKEVSLPAPGDLDYEDATSLHMAPEGLFERRLETHHASPRQCSAEPNSLG